MLAPARYATELYKLGFTDVHVRVQVDVHELAATAEVVEWTRGSTLTRFTSVLPNDVHDEFIDAYRRAVIAELGEERPYRYTFERILAVGRRSTT